MTRTQGNDEDNVWEQIAQLFVRGQTRIDTRLGHLESDVAILKADVAILKTDVATLKVDVAVLKADVAVLKADVFEIKTDIVGLKIEVSELKGQLTRLELAEVEREQRMDAKFEWLAGLIRRDERGAG